MRELKNELQSMEGDAYDENHRRKAVDALRRMESWNLFSDTIEVLAPLFILYETLQKRKSSYLTSIVFFRITAAKYLLLICIQLDVAAAAGVPKLHCCEG